MVKKNNNKKSIKKNKKSAAVSRSADIKERGGSMVAPVSVPAKKENTILGDIGQWAGNAVSKIFGWGAYDIQQNTVYQDMLNSSVPVMHSSSETVVFRHREYIADISSTTAFNTIQYAVNPGLPSTFPFLNAIAQNFQEYQFRGLVFEYKSTSANALNSTNTALGTVMLAAQYRADAPSFLNKQQLLNEMWSIDCKPSCDILLPIECAPIENPMAIQYVRSGAVPSGQDTKLFDLCNLTVATYGSQAAAVVGELWATYEIVLYKPKLSSGLGFSLPIAHYGTVASDNTNYFGTSQVLKIDNIGLEFGSKTITFPTGLSGQFNVELFWTGGSTALTTPNIVLTNCNDTSTKFSSTSILASPQTGETSVSMIFNVIITIPDPTLAAVLTYSAAVLPTSITRCDIYVSQVNQLSV